MQRIFWLMVLLSVSSTSYAWENQYYIGFGMGGGFFSKTGPQIEESLRRQDWQDPVADIASNSTIWKGYMGAYFSPFLGAQIGYVNLGNTDLTASAVVPPGEEAQFAEDLAAIEPDLGKGVQVSVTGRFRIIDNLIFHDWLGVYIWENDSTVTVNDLTVKETSKGTNLFLGAAVEYQLNYELGLRMEVERFNQKGDDVSVLGLGVAYYF